METAQAAHGLVHITLQLYPVITLVRDHWHRRWVHASASSYAKASADKPLPHPPSSARRLTCSNLPLLRWFDGPKCPVQSTVIRWIGIRDKTPGAVFPKLRAGHAPKEGVTYYDSRWTRLAWHSLDTFCRGQILCVLFAEKGGGEAGRCFALAVFDESAAGKSAAV